MPDLLTIDIKGIEELNRRLMQIAKSVDTAKTAPILLRGAEMIAAVAREEAPYAPKPAAYAASKHLRDTIVAKNLAQRNNQPSAAIAAIDRKGVPHWSWVVNGTKMRSTKAGANRGRTKANRFLRRARKRVEQQVVSYVAGEVAALIREAAKP